MCACVCVCAHKKHTAHVDAFNSENVHWLIDLNNCDLITAFVVTIFQGEVEQIAMMKPKAPNEHEDGMLEFLEDIIGCSRFKEPIERVASRVEELNEMRGEKV